ncbi:glycosyl hydrolase 2 galactose-binding domain-containing protein [Enterococcus avium]
MQKKSLDEVDYEIFGVTETPVTRNVIPVSETKNEGLFFDTPLKKQKISLNGEWALLISDEKLEISAIDWQEALETELPSTVHTSLFAAGLIEDPSFEDNQEKIRAYSFKNVYYRKEVTIQKDSFKNFKLHFEGIANKCEIWINGEKVISHEGMFGVPPIDLVSPMKKTNKIEIIVHVFPAEFLPSRSWYDGNNDAWKKTVVMNNVYGWHYSNLPTIGIWNDCWIERNFGYDINAFLFVKNYDLKKLGLQVDFSDNKKRLGILHFSIRPKNFSGESLSFSEHISAEDSINLSFEFPEVYSWWPNGLGEANLYEFMVYFEEEGNITSYYTHDFGFRTIEMRTSEEKNTAERYKWQFVVNGQPFFLKGAGWCTMDALLNLKDEKYQRFLTLAQKQHIQFIRAWGGGIPEKDYFYQLCDELGIMVMQEWPTAWDSDKTQPEEILLYTAKRHTLRLRNFPSLVMYCGGNESREPNGQVIDEFGRIALRYDGTRPYHRTEPYGGSLHDHECYWERRHLDHYLELDGSFLGEFGLPSFPNYESVQRYISEGQIHQWPPSKAFQYHTPVMGKADDVDRLSQVASYFAGDNASLTEMIHATQMIQGLAISRVIEKARTTYPDCTGTIYYKLNDNYPAASWSTIDWYGVPKSSYYMVKHSLEPIKPVLLFNKLNQRGMPQEIPLYILNDNCRLRHFVNIDLKIQVYDENLNEVFRQEIPVSKYTFKNEIIELDAIKLDRKTMKGNLLFFVIDMIADGTFYNRSTYYQNIENNSGIIFDLPRTSVKMERLDARTVKLMNVGEFPALGVEVYNTTDPESFESEDNHIFLKAGEDRQFLVTSTNSIRIKGLNLF